MTPRVTVALAHTPTLREGSVTPRPTRPAVRQFDRVRSALAHFFQALTTPRAGLWRADELPDALLKDVDPQLYEARVGRSTGWFAGDHHRMPPF